MKKRFLNLFLALALVVCALPMVASAATGCRHDKSASTTIKKVEAKAATCVEAGYEAYYTCDYCKCIFAKNSAGNWVSAKKVPVPATGKHDYSVNEGYRTGDEPTCTKTGISVLKCSKCDARTAQTAPVDKTNHTYVSGLCTECGDCENKHVSNKIVTAAKAATCAEDGVRYNVYQCKICDVFFCNNVVKETNDFPENVIPATGSHVLSTKLETVTPATCTEKEVARYKCRNCNYTEDVAIGQPLGHQWQGLSEVPATCATEGKTAGTWCWVCKYVREGMEPIEKTPHTSGAMIRYIKRPTCQETGEAEYKCTGEGCEETIKKVIAKLNCNIVEKEGAVAPTCNNTGLSGGTKCDACNNGANCAYCKETLKDHSVLPALGHDQVLVNERIPTCTKDGWKMYDCTRCGYDGVKVTVNKLGHDKDITVVKEATCTTDGRQYFECKREGCGHYQLEEIAATGHTEEVVPAVAATCTSTGLTEGKKCSVCDETLLAQVVTDKLAHDFSVSVDRVEATCTADGYTAHMKCANCDATEGKEELDTDGHVYENYICKVCGGRDGSCEHKNRVLKYTAPTCSDKGSQSMWCPDCNYETMEMLDKVAHTPVDKSIAATCTTKGLKHIVCSVCNVDLEKEETPVIAHSNVQGVCSVCGTTVCDHSSTSITSTTSSCSVAGIKTETCNSCGKVTKTELPLAAHNHVNGVCSACGHKDSNRITSDYQDFYVIGGTAY